MKPHLLIIPGWEGSQASWRNFIDRAENDFTVWCFDLPCFGDKPCPEEVWGIEEYAEFIRKKITENNISKPILLGHSFGGQIAAYLATAYPAEFSKLILSGAAVFRRTPRLKKIIFLALAKTGKMLFSLPPLNRTAAFMKKALYRLANSDYNDTSGIKREIYKKIINQDLSQLAAKITLPTLIIWGGHDRYVPLKQGKKIARQIPGARLEIIKNAGHGLHLKHLNEFYSLIKKFV